MEKNKTTLERLITYIKREEFSENKVNKSYLLKMLYEIEKENN